MLFNSYEFLFAFLPLAIILFYTLPKSVKVGFLLVVSYIFYGAWNAAFLPLLIFSTVVDFLIGIKLAESDSAKKRKYLLLLSIFMNLGVLGFFKYFNFALDNTNFILSLFGLSEIESNLKVILPVGISFYTFQSMSYTIDLYRGHFKPYKNFISFATYVAFFPQLIAGPIIRHDELVDQINESTKRKFNKDFAAKGTVFFIIGLSKKILIADNIANAINPVIDLMPIATTLEAWMCALGYTAQLYFDFSGYSDMAVGLGFMFGLKFPQNFNSPYKATSITDFWRRWHMTLSFWLRDYLYISLGGNRKGSVRTYMNLVMTMLLGGLWHGAAWTYVIWGGIHGSVLAIERYFGLDKKATSKLSKLLKQAVTFFIVVIAWVVFRSESGDLLSIWYQKLLIFEEGLYPNFKANTRDRYATALVIGFIIAWTQKNTFEIRDETYLRKRTAIFSAVLFFICTLFLAKNSPFLYFQF